MLCVWASLGTHSLSYRRTRMLVRTGTHKCPAKLRRHLDMAMSANQIDCYPTFAANGHPERRFAGILGKHKEMWLGFPARPPGKRRRGRRRHPPWLPGDHGRRPGHPGRCLCPPRFIHT